MVERMDAMCTAVKESGSFPDSDPLKGIMEMSGDHDGRAHALQEGDLAG